MKNLIPRFIAENYKKGIYNGNFEAGAMFVDISGFTAITETLANQGKEGAEILSKIINEVFSPCIRSVYERGGFIVSFEGDAFIAVFPANYRSGILSAFDIIKVFRIQSKKQTKFGEFDVFAKVGLSFGKVEWGIAGNSLKKTYYFRGKAVDSCSIAERHCSLMDIIIDESLYEKLTGSGRFEKCGDGLYKAVSLNMEEKTKEEIGWDVEDSVLNVFVPSELTDSKPPDELRDIVSLYISFRDVGRDHSSLSAFSQDILNITYKWGGYFNQIGFDDKGGNILIKFGCPVSYENNIERALNCIYEVRSIYNEMVRAGISFGRVFAGFIGSSTRASYDVLGDAVNLSARMAVSSPWGSIWISRALLDIAKRFFGVDYVKEFLFKGKSVSIEVYEIKDRMHDIKDSFHGNLYGRELESERLAEFISPIFKSRFAGILYIYGDAGIGKSRLVYDYTRMIRNKIRLCILQCDNIIKKAWNPFINYLTVFFEQKKSIQKEKRSEEFKSTFDRFIRQIEALNDSRSGNVVRELKRTEPFLRVALSLDSGSMLYEQLNPEQRYNNTMFALKEFFKGLSLIKPVIIQFEDINWMDSESKDLIKHITRNIAEYPLAIICTSRYNDDGSKPQLDLEKEIKIDEIMLKRISDNSVREIIREILGVFPDDELFHFIKARSLNNPFFVEQFCLYLKENSNIILKKHQCRIKKTTEEIPTEISQVLIARIDRLTREIKELMKIASALGLEFDRNILFKSMKALEKRLMDYPGDRKKFDHDAIKGILRTNKASLLRKGELNNLWDKLDEVRYIFKHALICETAYDMQLRERLRLLHHIFAGTIESYVLKEKELNKQYFLDLAYHYEKAGIRDKTIEYIRKSADYLSECYKNYEAVKYYNKLLGYIEDKIQIVEINMKIAGFYKLLGIKIQPEEIFNKCIEISKSIDNKQLLAKSYNGYGNILMFKDMYKEALDYFVKSRTISEEIGDKKIICSAVGSIGMIYSKLGRFDNALNCFETQKKIAKEINDRHNTLRSIVNSALIYSYKGEYKKALKYYKSSRDLYEDLGDKHLVGITYGNMAGIYIRQGNNGKVMECSLMQKSIAEEIGDKTGMSLSLGNMGNVYYNSGDYDKALEHYQKSRIIAEEIGYKNGIMTAIFNIGNIFMEMGQHQKALKYFRIAKRLSHDTGYKRGYGIALGYIGDVYLSIDDHQSAFDSLSKSVKILKELQIIDEMIVNYMAKISGIYLYWNDINGAKRFADEAIKAAEKIGDKNSLINAEIMKLKIQAKDDESKAVQAMLKIIDNDLADNQIADIYYELFILKRAEIYKNKAIKIYEKLYSKHPKYEYRKKLHELKRSTTISR